MKTTAKTVPTMKRMVAKLVFSLAVCALVSPGVASAQGVTPFFPFKDSFDGPIDDNRPVSWSPVYGPETLTVNHGDLILTTPASLVPGVLSLGLAVVVADGAPMVAGNTSAEAVVRVSDPFAFASIWTKGQNGPPAGDGAAYVARIGPGGELAAEVFGGVTITVPTDLDPTTRDVVLQLKVIGNKIKASAWAKDKPKKKYHVTNTDPAAPRPPGGFGIGYGGFSLVGDNVAGTSATFHSFEVKNLDDDDEGEMTTRSNDRDVDGD